MMEMIHLNSLDIENKRLLIREDFNVPLDDKGHITHDVRLREALPSIQYALSKKASIILMSHLGRPEEGHFDKAYSLRPVAEKLSELLNQEVRLIGLDQKDISLAPQEVVLLENVRFLKGEKENDPQLSKWFASLCDIFVMDAFSVSHRKQASTEGVAHYAKTACAGFSLQKELEALSKALHSPKHPLVAIVGGSKVSTKFKVLDKLLDKVDALVVGGGMANTFLKANGYPVGNSLYEESWIHHARRLIQKAQKTNKDLLLPLDVVVAKSIEDDKGETKDVSVVSDEDIIFDIGPKSLGQIIMILQKANTIVWNGPLGVFEKDPFSHGTKGVAKAISQSHAFSLAGGGDTLAAIEKFDVSDISYQSTAGGAFLEFLEGRTLPGIEILKLRSQNKASKTG